MDELLVKVGDRIRNLRKDKGITQEELAERSSLHNTYIGKVERGEKNLTIESLVKITDALEINLGEFFSTINPKLSNDSPALLEVIDIMQQRSEIENEGFLEVLKTLLKVIDKS